MWGEREREWGECDTNRMYNLVSFAGTGGKRKKGISCTGCIKRFFLFV